MMTAIVWGADANAVFRADLLLVEAIHKSKVLEQVSLAKEQIKVCA